jgi:hypothetical protein
MAEDENWVDIGSTEEVFGPPLRPSSFEAAPPNLPALPH